MDNVSHSLMGLALSRAGLNRLTPRATVLLLLSANFPDIDFVTVAKNQLAYLEIHRGPTHALLAVPILALEVVVIVAAIFRQKLPWFQAWLVCCIGVLSHLLLDLTNNYGIRLLLPFSLQWFHLDLNSLTDGPILAALALAAIWPWLSGLVSGEIGEAKRSTGQGIAIAMLFLCAGYDAARYNLHKQAVTQLESRLYQGAVPSEVAALPTSINPFRWRGIVATKAAFLRYDFNILTQLNTESADRFFRIPTSDVTAAPRQTPEFNYFLYFARFPVWSVQPVALNDGSGKRIELTDLRFGEPGTGSFHCIAVENPDGKVIASWFTYGNGADLGWTDPRSKH
jgi:inner membrane protein